MIRWNKQVHTALHSVFINKQAVTFSSSYDYLASHSSIQTTDLSDNMAYNWIRKQVNKSIVQAGRSVAKKPPTPWKINDQTTPALKVLFLSPGGQPALAAKREKVNNAYVKWAFVVDEGMRADPTSKYIEESLHKKL